MITVLVTATGDALMHVKDAEEHAVMTAQDAQVVVEHVVITVLVVLVAQVDAQVVVEHVVITAQHAQLHVLMMHAQVVLVVLLTHLIIQAEDAQVDVVTHAQYAQDVLVVLVHAKVDVLT